MLSIRGCLLLSQGWVWPRRTTPTDGFDDGTRRVYLTGFITTLQDLLGRIDGGRGFLVAAIAVTHHPHNTNCCECQYRNTDQDPQQDPQPHG